MSTETDHIDTLLSGDTPEKEFAAEIAEYEKEEAAATKKAEAEAEAKAAPVEVDDEPEADDEPELEAADDDQADDEPEAEPEAEPEPQEDKQVSLKALQAQRAKTQELQQELDKIKTYLSAQQQQQPRQPEQEQQAIPDPDENPIEALQYLMRQNRELAEQQQQTVQQQQQQAYLAQVQQQYATAAQQYAAEKPDFQEAYSHLLQSRARELELNGLPQEQINNQIQQEEYGFAIEALRAGVNPAERIYRMAEVRGYRPAAAKPAAKAAPVSDPALDEAKKAAATNTNRSKPPSRSLSLEEIADLDGAAFDKAMAKYERENGLAPKSFM